MLVLLLSVLLVYSWRGESGVVVDEMVVMG